MGYLDGLPIYVVGRLSEGGYYKWDIQGVYYEETMARMSCRDETYFYMVMKMSEPAPHKTIVREDAIFPMLEAHKT